MNTVEFLDQENLGSLTLKGVEMANDCPMGTRKESHTDKLLSITKPFEITVTLLLG